MSSFALVARQAAVASLRSSGPAALNWLYLVENIVVVILVLFYFFYFNRIGGIVVSFLLRCWLWKSSNAYFEIGGIQFAPLGGRIIFTDFRYISRNQSLRIVKGHITWRYWLWRVRSEEDRPSEARLPCRITVSLTGAEWFLYNRTPSYDAILEQLGVTDPLSTLWDLRSSDEEKLARRESEGGAKESQEKRNKAEKRTTDWLREALPIEIKCSTGAIIMGNPSTSNIVIAGFDKVAGSYAAVKSRSRFDEYKQIYRLTFTQPKIVFRTNPDYEGPMDAHGEAVLSRLQSAPAFLPSFHHTPTLFATLPLFRSLLCSLPLPRRSDLNSTPSPSAPTQPWSWQGLPRYQTGGRVSDSVQHVEYAKVTTLLTSPELEMTYYCDTAGKVPPVPRVVTGFAGLETCDIGNGDLSPEWGVDLVIKGGIITYGPWADRQRSELQQAFTPTTFFDAKETPKLKPGELRMHTALKVFVEFSEGATMRIPTREVSKDWRYDGLEIDSLSDATIRPYGWLDVTLGPNSTLSYVLPMVATPQGYDTLVEFHLDEMSVSSSVNYATFLKAETCRVHVGLPSPLVWHALRTWTINVTMAKPDISLLRDHITLFTDVAKDWTSGPPGSYEHFVPYVYVMNFTLSDYSLRLFVNDHNIINNPATIEDNTLIIAKGPRLVANTSIPSDGYRMECSVIPFRVAMTSLALSMSLPDWNTHSAFLTERSRTFATTPELNIDGSYRFYSNAHEDNVERLAIAVDCHDVVFKTMGWMIRHLFNLRDNYFGTFTHFVTLEEYRHRHERNLQGDPLELKYRPDATDVFEVVVSLELRNGLMLMPQELYDCRTATAFVIPIMQVDLRNHDFFMEMSLNIEPFRILETTDCDAIIKQDFASLLEQADSIRVQGLEVTADRLFGPQPRTATYMCIWSFYLGTIVGSVPPSFFQAFARTGASLAANFVDQDNSLPPDFSIPLDPDATFLTVDLRSVDLAVRGAGTAIQIDLPDGVKIRFDDLASAPFLKHANIEVPTLYLRFLAPLFGRAAPWMEVASLDGDLSIVLGLSASGWEERVKSQLAFVALQDELTKRCPFLYEKGPGVSSHRGGLFLPALEAPLVYDGNDLGRNSYREPASAKRHEGHRWKHDDDERMAESDTSSEGSFSDLSETSEDDYEAIYSRLPGRSSGGDRFSAYGAILQLCERAPEAAFLDKPTFQRLPPAVSEDTRALPSHSTSRDVSSAKDRLAAFGPPSTRKSLERTSVDISSRRPIRIVLTPVAVQVGADVLESMPIDRDLEHRLDDLLSDYVGSQDSIPAVRYDNLELRVALPSVEIESIQDVLRPEDTISIKPREGGAPEGVSTVLCTARLVLDNVAIFLSTTSDGHGGNAIPPDVASPSVVVEQRLCATAGGTHLEVFHPSQSANPGSTRQNHTLPTTPHRQRPTALELRIGPCELDVVFKPERAQVALNGGDARLDFVDEAAELVIGSLWSWRVINDVAGPLAERAAERKTLARRLLWSVAEASEHSSISSFPTFLNRVSYLVGSSTNLRSDDGWKILHQLRHCLREAHADVERSVFEPKAWPSSATLLSDIVDILSRWRSWEIDADDLSQSPFLFALFGAPVVDHALPTPPATLAWDVPFDIEWRAGRFEALLSDGKTSDNWLAIGPLEAFVSSSGRPSVGGHLRVRGRATLQLFDGNVDRDLLLLVRHIIKVRRTFEHKIQLFREGLVDPVEDGASTANDLSSDFLSSIPSMLVDISFGIRHLSATALADSLEAKAAASDVGASISVFVEPAVSRSSRPMAHQLNANSSFTIGGVSFAAREVTPERDELLLSAEIEELSVVGNALGSHAWEGGRMDEIPSLHVVVAARAVRTRVPRAAIRIYEFVENWRNQSFPIYDSLLTELRQGLDDIQADIVGHPHPPPTPSLVELLLAKARIGVLLAIPLVSLEMQAIPTLKMGYSIHDLSAHARTVAQPQSGQQVGSVDAGLAIVSQTVQFIPVSDGNGVSDLPSGTSFELPVVRLKARLDGVPCRHVTFLATVDSISLKLTAAIIDHILTVQDRFGSDVDELLGVFRRKRDLLAAEESEPARPSQAREPLEWEARIALRGFKVGVEGPQATQWIEAELLEGYARSSTAASLQQLHWQAWVQNLALSLSQRTAHAVAHSLPSSDRRYRLAFFRLDLSLSNTVIDLPELPQASAYGDALTPHLHLRFPRIHAVLQPTAIEALGDLIDYFAAEINQRQTSRRGEVEAIRERVIQTLEMAEKPTDASTPSWLSTCVISLEAQSIGLAIPLSDEGIPAAEGALRRGKSSQSRPAFLVTISSIKFATQRGSEGYARIVGLQFQFVAAFDQGRKENFEGPTHQSLNRIVLPEMHCTLRTSKDGPTLVHSAVSGLEIDFESSAVAFAFSLIDVYRQSHERFAKFAPQPLTTDPTLPLSTPPSPILPPLPSSPLLPSPPLSQLSTVQATFEFASGIVRLHTKSSAWNRGSDGPTAPKPGRPKSHRRGGSLNDFGSFRGAFAKPLETPKEAGTHADVFRIPGLSVWAEYQDAATGLEVKNLHVDVVIHASKNVLYPTLIPFISDVASQLERRALQSPRDPPSSSAPSTSASLVPTPFAPPVPCHLKLGLSLKIDQSRLDISCLPVAEVTARLTWESGGFLFAMSPDVKGAQFAVTVDGVAAGLKHSFSPDDCLHAEAKGLAASISFQAADEDAGRPAGVVSAVVDIPDISAEMNFRHLQDWLALKAVWIDRMDLGPAAQPDEAAPALRPMACIPEVAAGQPQQANLTTLVLVEVRKLCFICDLGPSIGRSTFTLDAISSRIRWVAEESRCVSLGIGKVGIEAEGKMEGSASLDGMLFETRLRDDGAEGTKASDLLHINIGIGKLSASLDCEIRKILILDVDPIAIKVVDDWSRATTDPAELELAFDVKMGSLSVIATVGTLPALLNVARKVQALVDEKVSVANATIARAGLPPRPNSTRQGETAVSLIASKLGTESSPGEECSIRILNRLAIAVDRIRIAVFPGRFDDGEVYRLDAGSSIRAQLVRGVTTDRNIHRDLHLFLGFFSIRKVNHRKLSKELETSYSLTQWFELFRTSTERNIFKVPTTQVSMESDQLEGTRRLEHKFTMIFEGQVDMALNYALIRNLQDLGKSFQAQMDSAGTSFRTATSASVDIIPPVESSSAAPSPRPDSLGLPSTVPSRTINEEDLPRIISDVTLMPLGSAAGGESRVLEYHATEMNVHQPKLNLLGEATPPLEWLGLQRARFPALIHTGVTATLEKLLLGLSSTYMDQLVRQKFKEPRRRPAVAGAKSTEEESAEESARV